MVLEVHVPAEGLGLVADSLGSIETDDDHSFREDPPGEPKGNRLEIHDVDLTAKDSFELDADGEAALETRLRRCAGLEVDGDVDVAVRSRLLPGNGSEEVRERDRLVGEHGCDRRDEFVGTLHVAAR